MNSLTCGRGSYSCTDHRSLVFAWQVTLRFGHTRSISDLSTRLWLSSKVISVAPAEPRCGLWCHGVASELGTIFNLAVDCHWVHHLRCCSFKMQQGHYRSFLQRYQALATPSVMDFRVPWVQVPLSLSLALSCSRTRLMRDKSLLNPRIGGFHTRPRQSLDQNWATLWGCNFK